MDIRELRIGNYYIWKAEGKDYVYQVQPKDFADGNYKNFLPIELNEKWLLNFGFEKIHNTYEGEIDCEYILSKGSKYCGFYLVYQDDLSIGISSDKEAFDSGHFLIPEMERFQYVHQLQNLYFTLTGKELQLSDKAIV